MTDEFVSIQLKEELDEFVSVQLILKEELDDLSSCPYNSS